MPKRKSNLKGRGVTDTLSKINNFVRTNQLLSKGLAEFAPNQFGSATAAQLGYGKRRRVPRKRRVMAGRGLFDSIGSVLGSIGHGIGSGGYGLLSGLTGSGKRHRVLKL
jgi:hypothetical protein